MLTAISVCNIDRVQVLYLMSTVVEAFYAMLTTIKFQLCYIDYNGSQYMQYELIEVGICNVTAVEVELCNVDCG